MSKVTNLKEVQPIKQLPPSNFQLAEHSYRRHNASIPDGVTPEDIVNTPNYFSHVAARCQLGDEIRAVSENGTWIAVFFVTYAYGREIRVAEMFSTPLERVEPVGAEAEYKVALCGTKRFCIIRQSDAHIVKEGIPTKLRAEQELDDYLRALNA